MQTEYDIQAEQFLLKHGIKCRITLSDTKPANWEPAGHHYRVTLSKSAGGRITFDFWGSVADAKKLAKAQPDLVNMQLQMQNTEPHLRINWRDELEKAEQAVADSHPSPYDILACLSGDVHCPETFKDFCGEFGYEQDSIKALQTFKRASSFSKRLRAFFTADEIEALQEIN